MKNITQSNWNAWINRQPIQTNPYGVLHVTGEAISHPSKVLQLVKKEPQGINENILLLEIVIHNSGLPTKQPQFLHYSEAIRKEQPYNSIEVFYEVEKIIMINDIPVVL